MPMSPFLADLRALVGDRLLLLPGVAAIVRDAQGRVLFVRSGPDARWGLPAGAAEPGETAGQAIVREVFEETGMDVVPEHLVGVFSGPTFRETYPNGHEGVEASRDRAKGTVEWTVMVFECRHLAGAFDPIDGEVGEVAWFDVVDAPTLALGYPADLLEPRPATRFQPLDRVVATEAHQIPERAPLRIRRGERVTVDRRDDTWPAFVFVRAGHGEGWVPARHLSTDHGEAEVVEGYDTTELPTVAGQALTVLRRDDASGWLWCLAEDGRRGWVPARTVGAG